MQINTLFYNHSNGVQGREELSFGDYSKVDQYADAVSLSMAYYLDPAHPLESVLWARYYEEPYTVMAPSLHTMNESYVRTVEDGIAPNQQYMRYWHGSLILIRPMLVLWNYKQIKCVLGIVMGGLLAALLFLLVKHKRRVEAVSIAISMFAVSVWYVPLSLEYIWMFLLMLGVSIITVRMCVHGRMDHFPMLMFITGMLAAYFDFFTTETITLLIPLLLAVRIGGRNYSDKDLWLLTGKCCVLWGIGYVGCWMAKWGLSAVVFHRDMIPYIRDIFLVHLGAMDEVPATKRIRSSLLRNIWPLFPIGYGLPGALLFAAGIFLLVFVPVCRGTIVIRQQINGKRILLYLLLGMIVYVRFIVLRHHVWMHYFFTYRAQAVSVLALCLVLFELVEIRARKAVI